MSVMNRRSALRPLAAAALAPLVGLPSKAQTSAGRPISLVLPTGPGAPSDLVGRLVGKSMATQAGVPVVPDNKPGANGIIGVQAVLNAPADGNTVLFTTMSTMAVNKALIKALPYDPLKDLTTLGVGYRTWLYVIVSSKLPVKTLPELIAYAKREPGKLNFGYGTSVPQMAGKLFEQKAGVQFTFIPYKSHAMMMQALVPGEVDVTITDPLSFNAFVKGGQARVLAAASPTRMTGFTDVPTLAEARVPDCELGSAHVCMVRASTPPDAVARLTEWLKGASRSAELKAFLDTNNLDSFLVTGAEATQYLVRELERWGAIARTAGLQPS